jgi:hypothetical protein
MPVPRQRLLLTLLDGFGGDLGNLDFQKLLFLYTQECEIDPSYDFVPYKFGGFSFTCYADKRRLTEQGLLSDEEQSWQLSAAGKKEVFRAGTERITIDRFCRSHSSLRGTPLVAHAYKRHPYYATRSEIVDAVLPNATDRAKVLALRPKKAAAGLATIGYEGKSLESYLNQLLGDGVTLLCDVRRNPLSRKYGFSKGTLANACQGLNIKYVHLPELGIPSDRRQELNTQEDYDALFEAYELRDLPKQGAAVKMIVDWINQGERVALTCFEILPEQCHRHCVAEAVSSRLRKGGIRHLGEVCRKTAFSSR